MLVFKMRKNHFLIYCPAYSQFGILIFSFFDKIRFCSFSLDYSTGFLGGLFHSRFFLKIAAKAGGAKEKINAGKVSA